MKNIIVNLYENNMSALTYLMIGGVLAFLNLLIGLQLTYGTNLIFIPTVIILSLLGVISIICTALGLNITLKSLDEQERKLEKINHK